MITDNDIKKLKKDFATKADLKVYATKEDLLTSIDRIIKYVDFRFEQVEEKLDKVIKNVDFIMEKLDWLVKAYTKFEDEYLVLSHQYSRVDKSVDDHEARITTIEKKVN